MSTVQVVVKLHTMSGILKDYAENTWAFQSGTLVTPETLAAGAVSRLATFYTSIGGIFSKSISRTSLAHEMLVYDIADELETPGAGIGSPILSSPFTLPAATANPGYPSEVAICLSMHGALAGIPVEVGTTRPAARHHGRVYLGPLNVAAGSESDPNLETRPATGVMTTIKNAAETLMEATDAVLSVWSRVNAALYIVNGGWVDNAFDTQRRRGVAPNTRSIFGALL